MWLSKLDAPDSELISKNHSFWFKFTSNNSFNKDVQRFLSPLRRWFKQEKMETTKMDRAWLETF